MVLLKGGNIMNPQELLILIEATAYMGLVIGVGILTISLVKMIMSAK